MMFTFQWITVQSPAFNQHSWVYFSDIVWFVLFVKAALDDWCVAEDNPTRTNSTSDMLSKIRCPVFIIQTATQHVYCSINQSTDGKAVRDLLLPDVFMPGLWFVLGEVLVNRKPNTPINASQLILTILTFIFCLINCTYVILELSRSISHRILFV